MKQTKVLLVKLPYKDSHYNFYVDLPSALGILSEVLLLHDIDHDVYDMQLNNSPDDFYSYVAEFQPTIIGFSILTFKYLHNYQLINTVKQRFPNLQIIVGGPHASTFRGKILEECPGVDIVVPLEGEDILIELCNRKPIEEIKGILFRNKDKIVDTGNRELIQDLDKYPFPKYSKFDLRKYTIVSIISSRGCPYNCIYCPISTTIGKKWRAKSSEKVVEELEYWAINRSYYEIQIADDNFTFNKKRVLEICEGIKQRGFAKKLNLTLGNGVRADKVDRELLTEIREVGFTSLAFGVESGSDPILNVLKKGETLKTIEESIKLACELEFTVHLFFVVGTPGETEEDVYESIKLSQKYPVEHIAFYHLIPFPGTELYNWVQNNNRFIFKAPDYLNDASHWVNEPLFTTDELNIEKRKKLYHLANTSGQKYTRRVISRRFAKKLSLRYKMPFIFTYPVVAILTKHPFVKNAIKSTFIGKYFLSSLRQK